MTALDEGRWAVTIVVVKCGRFLRHTVRVLGRFVHLTVLFFPLAIMAPVCLHLVPRWRIPYFRWLLWSMKSAGATFIKLGQWGSTRPDVLPRDLCDLMSTLHSQAPAHRMTWTRSVIKRELGQTIEELFDFFDPVPIGSGTVAQVYRAKLRPVDPDGPSREVAVKVIHPGIEDALTTDLILLETVAHAVNLLPSLRWLDLPAEVVEFSRVAQQQVDLDYEAQNLAAFRRNFAHERHVNFPQPIFPLVTHSVLVETFEPGVSISALIDIVATPTSDRFNLKVVELGFNSLLKMVLLDNLVHADMHPGNIHIQFLRRCEPLSWFQKTSQFMLKQLFGIEPPCIAEETMPIPQTARELSAMLHSGLFVPQLLLLDAGLVTSMETQRQMDNFNDLFSAVFLQQNGREAGRLIIERNPDVDTTQLDKEQFCEEMGELIDRILGKDGQNQDSKPARVIKNFRNLALGSFQLRRYNVSEVLGSVFDLVRQHHVKLDPCYTNMLMSVACVEGVARQLSSDVDLLPYVRSAGLRYLRNRMFNTPVRA